MRIIFLNGPPRSGKDFGGNLITNNAARNLAPVKFATELKIRTHLFYKCFTDDGNVCPVDYFEEMKDAPLPQFEGLTPREAYIAMSEVYAKKMHGPKTFGKWLLDYLIPWTADWDKDNPLNPCDGFVITDSGFREEAEVLIDYYGAESCTLVRIHRLGHDFSGDSRGYIDLSDLGVHLVHVQNDGVHPQQYCAALVNALPELFIEVR